MELKAIHRMLDDISVPNMMRVRQKFEDKALTDISGEISQKFALGVYKEKIKPGMRVGITVGSRGIANMEEIVKAICGNIKRLGAEPCIIPAMGSHGEADARGQADIIKDFGITGENVGAPVLSGMEVEKLGTTENGLDVYYDKIALSLDGVIVLNRVKAHTDIDGDIESGLHKIIAIGLGNHIGAEYLHAKGMSNTGTRLVPVARYAMEHANILFGIAILENAYDHTAEIEFIEREKIIDVEPVLLARSRTLLPGLLVNDIDTLLVDFIGKEISGDGMDPNVIGRSMEGIKNKDIRIKHIIALDLSEGTGSNALGVGLADITTRRLYEKMEFEAMYTNAITAQTLSGVRIPIVMENDMMALKLSLKLNRLEDNSKARIAHVRNTVNLGQIELSEAFLGEVEANPRLEILSPPSPVVFDKIGNLRVIGLN